jgi:hypothetical protein
MPVPPSSEPHYAEKVENGCGPVVRATERRGCARGAACETAARLGMQCAGLAEVSRLHVDRTLDPQIGLALVSSWREGPARMWAFQLRARAAFGTSLTAWARRCSRHQLISWTFQLGPPADLARFNNDAINIVNCVVSHALPPITYSNSAAIGSGSNA